MQDVAGRSMPVSRTYTLCRCYGIAVFRLLCF
nr:MAG TPA: iron-binding zinc finger protein [Bacteriophage sp.]